MGRSTTKRAERSPADTDRPKHKQAQKDDSLDLSETLFRALTMILEIAKLRRGLCNNADRTCNLNDY